MRNNDIVVRVIGTIVVLIVAAFLAAHVAGALALVALLALVFWL